MRLLPSTRRLLTTAVESTTVTKERLAGTTPFHSSYVLLHSPDPPALFPSKVTSPLLRAVQSRILPFRGLVNFVWREDFQSSDVPSSAELEPGGRDAYDATIFIAGRGGTFIPGLSQSNLYKLDEIITASEDVSIADAKKVDLAELQLYVCTHGSRDCRCGETGGAVAKALRDELRRRRQVQYVSLNASLPDVKTFGDKIKIGEICHIGGHKYAGNVLVYPHGDWLGYVTPDDVPSILDAVLATKYDPHTYTNSKPLIDRLWRGRMGLEKEAQKALANVDSDDSSGVIRSE